MNGGLLEPSPDPMSRRELARRQRTGFRLAIVFFVGLALMLVLPDVVRSTGERVAAGRSYEWSGDTTIFVRTDTSAFCAVMRSSGTPERIYVTSDDGRWTHISGIDIEGGARTATLTCEADVTVYAGPLRLLSFPFRYWAAAGLLCIAVVVVLVWGALRTVYVRFRRGIQ